MSEQLETGYPPEYECCITYGLMQDPVLAADGFSYERVAIEKWFSNHGTFDYYSSNT